MKLTETLRKYKLKSTPCREVVLNLFFENEQALSQPFFEEKTDGTYDRVTLYRTLRSFEEKGLIHKVLDDNGITKYALCSECTVTHHSHEHVHFKCEQCGQTTCLDSIKIPKVDLPIGYKLNKQNLLVQGVCERCSQN